MSIGLITYIKTRFDLLQKKKLFPLKFKNDFILRSDRFLENLSPNLNSSYLFAYESMYISDY